MSTAKGNVTWVCVADSAGATLYLSQGPGTPFTMLDRIVPDLVENEPERPGRVHESAGPTRHAMEPRTDPARVEKQQVAHVVGEHLNAAAAVGSFDRLILVAPPRFLGDLRQALGDNAQKAVILEVNKELTRLDPKALREKLAEEAPV